MGRSRHKRFRFAFFARPAALLPIPMALLILLLLLLTFTACSAQTSDQDSKQGSSSEAQQSTTLQTEDTETAEGDGESEPDATRVLTQARRLVPETGTFSTCADCHAYLDPPSRDWPTLNDAVSHESHLERGAQCETCHQRPIHTQEGIRLPQMETCFECHNQEADGVASPTCYTCHPSDFPLEPSWHDEDFAQEGHARRIETEGMDDCFLCHEEVDKKGTGAEFCMDCHGMPIPHPKGWADTSSQGPGKHVPAAYDSPASCSKCHQNTSSGLGGCYDGECHGPAE